MSPTSPSCSRSSRRSRLCAGNADAHAVGRTRSSPTAATTRNDTDRRYAPRGIRPIIAKRRTQHGSGLGSQRWVVERTLSWLHQYRRLRIRYERHADIHQAFLSLACSLICLRQLNRSFC